MSLDDRIVPANNLTIQGAAFNDAAFVRVQSNGPTTTIRTKSPDAGLSIATIQSALVDPNTTTVIVTTDVANGQGTNNGQQAGNIVWDQSVAGNLDFTNFGTGKRLVFQTVNDPSAIGNITLSGVSFFNNGNGNFIDVELDSSAPGGNVSFLSNGMGTVSFDSTSVRNATIQTGTGSFTYTDGGSNTLVEVGGNFSATGSTIAINLVNGVRSFGAMTIQASGSISLNAGFDLRSTGNLTVSGTGTISGSNASLQSENGSISVSASTISLNDLTIQSARNVTLAGTTSLALTNGDYDIDGDVTFTGGTVELAGLFLPTTGDVGNVSISGTAVDILSSSIDSSGVLTVTGSTGITTEAVSFSAIGGATFTGNITATLGLSVDADGPISFAGTINGGATLEVGTFDTITFNQNVGSTTPLDTFELHAGTAIFGNRSLSTTFGIVVGGPFAKAPAVLSSSGTVVGNLAINVNGVLAPGGIGQVGAITHTGNLGFQDGSFAIDFGASGTHDQITSNGNVQIAGASMLGAGYGSGQMTSGTAFVLVASGTLTGTFLNAPVSTPVLVGTDAVTATYLSNQLLLTPFVPVGGANPTLVGVEADATSFRAALTGPGQVLSGVDWNGATFLVARNTTVASRLSITTTANASDDVVTFDAGVLISGSLASFTAPKVNIASEFRASGWIGSALFRDFLGSMGTSGVSFGGAPPQATSITARNIGGDVRTGSNLTMLKVTGALGSATAVVAAPLIGRIQARDAEIDVVTSGAIGTIAITEALQGNLQSASLTSVTAKTFSGSVATTGNIGSIVTVGDFVGTVRSSNLTRMQVGGGTADVNVTNTLGALYSKSINPWELVLTAGSVTSLRADASLDGNGSTWQVTNGIGSITVGSLSSMTVQAKFIGTVAVNGNVAIGLAPAMDDVQLRLTGNDGTTAKNALRSLTVKGNVFDSRITADAGNIGAVTVGRFRNSQIYLNYVPATNGDFRNGTFGQTGFRLASFRTTALPTTLANHPLQWAFADSEIAADSIGSVTLSGLQTTNSGTGFGIKVRKTGTTFLVKNASVTNDPDLPINVNLTADSTAPFTSLVDDFFYIRA